MRYLAFVHKGLGNSRGVSFPDFPGCISAGDTVEEALVSGAEALAGHVRIMESDGDPIPKPQTLYTVLADPQFDEDRSGATYAYVELIRKGAP